MEGEHLKMAPPVPVAMGMGVPTNYTFPPKHAQKMHWIELPKKIRTIVKQLHNRDNVLWILGADERATISSGRSQENQLPSVFTREQKFRGETALVLLMLTDRHLLVRVQSHRVVF